MAEEKIEEKTIKMINATKMDVKMENMLIISKMLRQGVSPDDLITMLELMSQYKQIKRN